MSDQPYTFRTRAEREDMLRQAVRGLVLTADDERTIAWLAGWATDTVESVVGLLDRVRATGGVEMLDLENAINERARGMTVVDLDEGNSGPGGVS
jgi:peptide subunit release factor 1 (eRF1)